MTPRRSAAPILATVLVVLLMLLAGYVGGYFWLGTLSPANQGIAVVNGVHYRAPVRWCRNFKAAWQTTLYQPLGQMESWLRGVEIELTSSDE